MSEEKIIDYDKLNKKELLGTIIGQKIKIERLNKELELERQIKKEVREYIENNKQYAELEDYGKNGEYYIDEIGLLEILDKVEENK